MIRGLSFRLPNNFNVHSYLFDIMNVFNSDFIWIVQHILLNDWQNKNISNHRNYNHTDFLAAAYGLHDESTLQNLELFGYFPAHGFKKAEKVDINTYSDFLSSEFTVAILMCDWVYCEIYLKDLSVLTILEGTAKNLGCTNIEITTDENDGRTVFHV